MDTGAIRSLWEAGDTTRAARAIYDALPDRLRPGWAADILELVCSRLPAVPMPVQAVVQIGRNRRRFRSAHAAFSAVRALTLAEDRTGAGGEYAVVLGIAEDAAKVIYNASGVREPIQPGEAAPFDEECGYLLAGGLCHLAQAWGAADFGRSAWAIQETWLRRAVGSGGCAEPGAAAGRGDRLWSFGRGGRLAMFEFDPDGPRWHALLLVPCGLLAVGLGVFMLYDQFWGGELPFVMHPVVSVLCTGAGLVGIWAGFRRLLRV